MKTVFFLSKKIKNFTFSELFGTFNHNFSFLDSIDRSRRKINLKGYQLIILSEHTLIKEASKVELNCETRK